LPGGKVSESPVAIARQFAAFGARNLLVEEIANRSGLPQRIEPRTKLIGIVCLIIGISFTRRVEVAAGAFLLALILVLLSRVRLREIGGLWLAIFLVVLLIGGGSMFDLVTPGRTVFTVVSRVRGLPDGLAITSSGLLVFSRLLLRLTASATLAYLLYVTTGPQKLLGALSSLGLPNIFVVLLLMTHRYLFVLVKAAEEIGLAMASRTIAVGRGASTRKLTVFAIGSLFSRSSHLANDVHHAMISRGFVGQIRFLKSPRPSAKDFMWSATCFIVAALLVCANG